MNDQVVEDPQTTSVNVLLIEDSSATQDLIKLMLEAAGHSIRIAGSGADAITALSEADFDVVLCDFHLPDFSGLEVVKRFHAMAEARPMPRFIAITGDVRGLLADRDNCEMFDRVIAKPLDIDQIVELVEAPEAGAPDVPPIATEAPLRSAIEDLGLAMLHWPYQFDARSAAALENYDAIFVEEPYDIERLWNTPGAHLLPIFDGSGLMGDCADLDVSTISISDIHNVNAIVDGFHNRRRDIHPDVLRSSEQADRLLCRMFLAGGILRPRLTAKHDRMAAWNTICDPHHIDQLLARLAADDLVRTEFFERLHACPKCSSGQVVVREECPGCGASNLSDDSYLHHFRCAYQGPEADFRNGDDLICPKCRRELSHFGRDYDRPGTMIQCQACREVTSDPVVAFLCAYCGTRTLGDDMPVKDVLTAHITEAGRSYVTSGGATLGPARTALRFGDFPLELTIALNRAAKAFNETKTPFTLGYIRYDALGDIESARQARDARRIWLETFQSALDDTAFVTAGRNNDFFLLPKRHPRDAEPALAGARDRANGVIRENLGCQFQLFGPEDLAP